MGKSEDDNREFNFSDNSGDFTSPSPLMTTSPNVTRSSSSRFANMDRRQLILIGVGSVVGVVILFKVLEWVFSPSKKPEAPAAPVTAIQPAAQMNGVIESRLQTQNSQLEKTQQRVVQLETTLAEIQTQLAVVNQAMQGISQQLQQQAAAAKAPPSTPVKKSASKTEEFAYYIQAMVPGRAWLVNQKGAVTTISVGDELPGFGTVSVIDREQGVVTTDKGMIRFHPGDR